jgi:hypothetical protein
MNRITIEYNGKDFSFDLPAAWSELTPKQVMKACRLYQRNLEPTAFKTAAAMALMPRRARKALLRRYARLQGKSRVVRNIWWRELISADIVDLQSELLRLADTLDFLKSPGKVTVNPLPKVRRLYGPLAAMRSCSYEEYAASDTHLRSWFNAKQAKEENADRYLHMALAVLWRPKGKIYDDRTVERRAKKIAKLPPESIDAMFLFVDGCFKEIVETFPRVFTGEDSGEEDGYGHAGLILDLAGSKFGDIEKTAATNLYTILMFVDMKIVEVEKQKAELEKSKKHG